MAAVQPGRCSPAGPCLQGLLSGLQLGASCLKSQVWRAQGVGATGMNMEAVSLCLPRRRAASLDWLRRAVSVLPKLARLP